MFAVATLITWKHHMEYWELVQTKTVETQFLFPHWTPCKPTLPLFFIFSYQSIPPTSNHSMSAYCSSISRIYLEPDPLPLTPPSWSPKGYSCCYAPAFCKAAKAISSFSGIENVDTVWSSFFFPSCLSSVFFRHQAPIILKPHWTCCWLPLEPHSVSGSQCWPRSPCPGWLHFIPV